MLASVLELVATGYGWSATRLAPNLAALHAGPDDGAHTNLDAIREALDAIDWEI